MHLTIQVLPLAASQRLGPQYRHVKLAQKPTQTFTVPVKSTQSFLEIWKKIEERYARNYVPEGQQSTFRIKKLQNVHGGDIDLEDVVGEFFEGETDAKIIRVVQAPLDRETSVLVTSGLRPPVVHGRKRAIEEQLEASKRRRVEEERYGTALEDLNPDAPVRSAEPSAAPEVLRLGKGTQEIQETQEDGHDIIMIEDSQQDGERAMQEEQDDESRNESSELSRRNAERQAKPITVPGESVDTEGPTEIAFKKPDLPASKARRLIGRPTRRTTSPTPIEPQHLPSDSYDPDPPEKRPPPPRAASKTPTSRHRVDTYDAIDTDEEERTRYSGRKRVRLAPHVSLQEAAGKRMIDPEHRQAIEEDARRTTLQQQSSTARTTSRTHTGPRSTDRNDELDEDGEPPLPPHPPETGEVEHVHSSNTRRGPAPVTADQALARLQEYRLQKAQRKAATQTAIPNTNQGGGKPGMSVNGSDGIVDRAATAEATVGLNREVELEESQGREEPGLQHVGPARSSEEPVELVQTRTPAQPGHKRLAKTPNPNPTPSVPASTPRSPLPILDTNALGTSKSGRALPAKWTEEAEVLLVRCVARGLTYTQAANHLPGRSAEALRKKYKVLDENFRNRVIEKENKSKPGASLEVEGSRSAARAPKRPGQLPISGGPLVRLSEENRRPGFPIRLTQSDDDDDDVEEIEDPQTQVAANAKNTSRQGGARTHGRRRSETNSEQSKAEAERFSDQTPISSGSKGSRNGTTRDRLESRNNLQTLRRPGNHTSPARRESLYSSSNSVESFIVGRYDRDAYMSALGKQDKQGSNEGAINRSSQQGDAAHVATEDANHEAEQAPGPSTAAAANGDCIVTRSLPRNRQTPAFRSSSPASAASRSTSKTPSMLANLPKSSQSELSNIFPTVINPPAPGNRGKRSVSFAPDGVLSISPSGRVRASQRTADTDPSNVRAVPEVVVYQSTPTEDPPPRLESTATPRSSKGLRSGPKSGKPSSQVVPTNSSHENSMRRACAEPIDVDAIASDEDENEAGPKTPSSSQSVGPSVITEQKLSSKAKNAKTPAKDGKQSGPSALKTVTSISSDEDNVALNTGRGDATSGRKNAAPQRLSNADSPVDYLNAATRSSRAHVENQRLGVNPSTPKSVVRPNSAAFGPSTNGPDGLMEGQGARPKLRDDLQDTPTLNAVTGITEDEASVQLASEAAEPRRDSVPHSSPVDEDDIDKENIRPVDDPQRPLSVIDMGDADENSSDEDESYFGTMPTPRQNGQARASKERTANEQDEEEEETAPNLRAARYTSRSPDMATRSYDSSDDEDISGAEDDQSEASQNIVEAPVDGINEPSSAETTSSILALEDEAVKTVTARTQENTLRFSPSADESGPKAPAFETQPQGAASASGADDPGSLPSFHPSEFPTQPPPSSRKTVSRSDTASSTSMPSPAFETQEPPPSSGVLATSPPVGVQSPPGLRVGKEAIFEKIRRKAEEDRIKKQKDEEGKRKSMVQTQPTSSTPFPISPPPNPRAASRQRTHVPVPKPGTEVPRTVRKETPAPRPDGATPKHHGKKVSSSGTELGKDAVSSESSRHRATPINAAQAASSRKQSSKQSLSSAKSSRRKSETPIPIPAKPAPSAQKSSSASIAVPSHSSGSQRTDTPIPLPPTASQSLEWAAERQRPLPDPSPTGNTTTQSSYSRSAPTPVNKQAPPPATQQTPAANKTVQNLKDRPSVAKYPSLSDLKKAGLKADGAFGRAADVPAHWRSQASKTSAANAQLLAEQKGKQQESDDDDDDDDEDESDSDEEDSDVEGSDRDGVRARKPKNRFESLMKGVAKMAPRGLFGSSQAR